MEHNNRNQYNGSGNGFLLGVIVGVLLTLLFTTKRGREILKLAMEKGVEKFADLEQLMHEAQDEEIIDEEFEEENDYMPTTPVPVPTPSKPKKEPEPEKKHIAPAEPKEVAAPKVAKEKHEEVEEPTDEKVSEKPKSPRGKRWFRGLRKKG